MWVYVEDLMRLIGKGFLLFRECNINVIGQKVLFFNYNFLERKEYNYLIICFLYFKIIFIYFKDFKLGINCLLLVKEIYSIGLDLELVWEGE